MVFFSPSKALCTWHRHSDEVIFIMFLIISTKTIFWKPTVLHFFSDMTAYSEIQSLFAFTGFWKTYVTTQRNSVSVLDTKDFHIIICWGTLGIYCVTHQLIRSIILFAQFILSTLFLASLPLFVKINLCSKPHLTFSWCSAEWKLFLRRSLPGKLPLVFLGKRSAALLDNYCSFFPRLHSKPNEESFCP